MELSVQTCEAIFHASPMHDIGKIGVPDSVLLKVGQLSDEEWVIMKTHCAAGAIILSTGTSPYVRMGAEIALNHHERWDGSGYLGDRRRSRRSRNLKGAISRDWFSSNRG
nr:HD domain-containing phosphohydrolase [Jezberella montanilacus]